MNEFNRSSILEWMSPYGLYQSVGREREQWTILTNGEHSFLNLVPKLWYHSTLTINVSIPSVSCACCVEDGEGHHQTCWSVMTFWWDNFVSYFRLSYRSFRYMHACANHFPYESLIQIYIIFRAITKSAHFAATKTNAQIVAFKFSSNFVF